MTPREFLKNFDFTKPNWENLPPDFPDCELGGLKTQEVGKFLAIKGLWELSGKTVKYGSVREGKRPFRIPTLEKTRRQAQSIQGYKASGYWQTASLLRDLLQVLLKNITEKQYRRKNQLEDASRSMVSTFEEGWGRPTTKELLDYCGFSQGSLAEVRGDVERLHTDSYLPSNSFPSSYVASRRFLLIPTPSRNFPYPPVKSRKFPSEYGKIRERLREFTGREIRPQDITYEILTEFVNKADYLLRKIVEGLQAKIVSEEKQKLHDKIRTHWEKEW